VYAFSGRLLAALRKIWRRSGFDSLRDSTRRGPHFAPKEPIHAKAPPEHRPVKILSSTHGGASFVLRFEDGTSVLIPRCKRSSNRRRHGKRINAGRAGQGMCCPP